ncbi:hemagglutinin repeat-containing protein [Xanthomonas phaseoli]|uniref:hemagglutinin repeat-containing protein n=1 Tax=Xanthomonas phaseoli TaxID=1985254 RepID=UPI00031531FA
MRAGRDLIASGTLQSASNLELQAQRALTFAAQGQAGGDISMRAATLTTSQDALLQGAGAIALDGGTIDSRGKLDAGGDLRVHSLGDMSLAGVAQGSDVELTATGVLTNAAQAFAGRTLTAQAQSLENTAAGVLAGGGDVTLTAAAQLNNAGRVQAAGELQMTAASLDQGGSASAGKTLRGIVAGTLDNRGNLIARDALQIDAGTLRSSGQLGSELASVALSSQGAMQLDGVVAAATALQVSAGGDLQQAGSLKAQSVTLHAGQDLTANGSLQSASTLDLQAQRTLALNGEASSAADATLHGATITTGTAAVLQSGAAITLVGDSIESRGALDAANDLTLRSAGDLTLGGVAQAGLDITLAATGILNNGARVIAARDLSVQASSATNASDATLGAKRDLRVDVAGVLDNRGSLHGERGLSLTSGSLLQRGRVYSGDALSIASNGAFENVGQLVSGKDLSINAGSIVSHGQLGSVTGALTLTSQNEIALQGVVSAATTLQVAAGGDLSQAGTLSAQTVALQAGGDLVAGGTLQSASTLDVQAQRTLSLSGQAQAGTDAALHGNSIATGRDAVLKSGGAITLDGAAIDSRGTLDAGTDLAVRSTGDLALAGVAQANRDVVLSATGALGNAGQVFAGRDLSLQAGSINNAAAGALAAVGGVALATGALQNAGSLQSGGDLRITAASMHQSGTAVAAKALTATVTGTLDNRGSLIAKDAVLAEAGTLRSSGQLGSEAANVTLTSQGDMTLRGVVAAATTLHAAAGGDLQQAGSLKAQSIALQAGRDLTAAGTLQSASQLDLQAQRGLALNGQAVSAANATLRGAQIATGQAAVLQSGAEISLDGAAIDSRGALDAATDINLRSTGELAVAGVVQADRNVVLSATGALTNAAQVAAGGGLAATAASASNTATGVLLAQGDATLSTAGLLDNAGAIRAGNQLSLGVGSLRQTGQAYGLQRLGVSASGAVDNRGDLIGGNALRVEAGQLSSSGQLGSERGDVALISRGNLQLDGRLASAGAFTAQADGALTQSGNLSAASTLDLRSTGDLTVAGQVAGQQLTLVSDAVVRQQGTVSGTTVDVQGARIENAGQTTAAGNLTLRAGQIGITGTVGAGINADGNLGRGSTLNLFADRQLTASGTLLVGGNLTAQGSQLQLAGATTRATGNVALTTGGSLDHRGGNLLAGGTLAVQAGGNIDNGRLNNVGGQLQANQLSIDGGSLSNVGGGLVLSGAGVTRVVIGGALDNSAGTLASNGQDLSITAASIENAQGRIEHAGTGTLSVTSRGALGNNSGRILTQGQLTLGASGALNNQSGAIAAAGDAGVSASSLNNLAGSVSARTLNVQTSGTVDNRNGLLQASGGALTLRADSLSNAGGTVQAIANAGVGGGLRVELNRNLDNGNGTIGASTDAVITAENISSTGGNLQAGRDLGITARGQLDNHQSGKLSAGRDLNVAVTGALLNSGGQLDAGNTMTVSAGRIDNTQASIVNNGSGLTRITTGGALTNTGGNWGGRGSVVIDAASIANTSGQLVAGGDLIANTNALNNQGGSVYAGANFLLQRAGATLDNQNGKVKAEQSVRLNLQNLSNAGGQIGAGSVTGGAGDVVIDTVGFDGGGSILAQNLLDLTLRSDYTHRAGADLVSNGNFNLRVGGNLVNESTLKAARTLDIIASSITNRGGANIVSNDTRLNGGNVIDNAGSISGNGALSLVANSVYNTGSIVGGNVSVNTGTLVNGADFGGATNNAAYGSALLGSTGNMNLIVREQLLNRDARIFSLGNIAIGGAQDGGGTLVSRTGVVNNLSGSIEADGSILIAAQQLNNRRRVINTTSVSTDPGNDGVYSGGELIEGKAIRNIQGARAPYPYKGLAPGIYRNYQVIQQEQLSSASAEGRIAAGGNILLSGSVTNNASTIAAAGLFAANQRGLGGLSDGMIVGGEQLLNQALALNQTVRQSDVEHIVTAITNDCMQPVGQKVVCYYEEEDQRLSSSTTNSSYIALGASMTGSQGVSINGANISNGAVGSDGRAVSGAALRGVGAQVGLNGRTAQSAGGVGGQAVVGRANGGASSIQVATGTTGSAGTQVGANTQDATLATSGGIVKMSVAPVMSNDSGLVRSSVDQATVQTTAAGTGIATGANATRTRVDQASIPVTNIVAGGQTSLTQIDLPIGGLYRLSSGAATDRTAMGRAAIGLGGINAWRSNGPGRRYLIETDPRFVNYDNFISSDFLLDKLGVDPEWTQTRLGDGFYEQRLVLDQITQLTGRRYLGNYADGVAQYRALLESGVAAAGQLQLSMGVGLTAAQAAALTQDIVWMVEQDYQGQKVLVPVVYLASNSLQLRGNGALIAGGNVELNASNSMSNQGVIAGADVSVTAGNLLNQGRISGTGTVALEARNDLLNQGQIQGRDVALVAGNNLVSEAAKAINGAGILSGISASNTLQLFAGNDMTLTAATAATKDGGITLAAGNDVNLLAESEQHDAVQDMTKKKKGTFSSKTTTTHDEWHDNVAVTTTLSGDTVQIAAGNDLLSQGAQVASTGDVVLAAGNNLTLDTVQNTRSEEHEKTVKKSGLYGGGGFSVALGVTKKTDGLDVTEVTNTGSLVGSTDGSVTMTAGNKVAITGSDVLSATSTTIVGKEVTIAAAENTVDTVQTSKQQSAGITLGLTGGAVDAAQAIYGAVKRGSEVEDDRLKALYAAKAGYAVSDTVGLVNNGLKGYDGQAVVGNTTKAGTAAADGAQGAANAAGVSLRLGIGASSSSSKTTTHEETTGGSRILSNGDITIAATGGDLNVIGSKIAGENVALAAANNLNLLSNKETNTTKSENKNAGGEIGISVGAVTGYYLSVSAGKGSAKGNSELRTESVVTANDTLTLVSGNDTTIQGAQAIGNKVLANVGGDLLIKSEQDTNEYKSKQQQASLTLATGSGSGGSYSQQKVNSSYTSVTEQSGIQAGHGGFDIAVGGNTKLVGGAIASTADASLNRLSTDSLTVEDLQNKAEYKTSGVSVAGGTGSSMASVAIGTGLSMLGNASDSSSSTTKSDIASGSIQIRSGDVSALAGLDRSATELQQSGLKEIFDQKKIEDQKELMALAGAVGFRAAGDIASSMQQRALREYAAASSNKDQKGMADAQAKMDSWGDGGLNKTLLHGLTGAAVAVLGGGDVAGGVLAAAGAERAKLAMAEYLRDKEIPKDSETYRALMELGSAAIGGALGGVAGANTALAGDQFNRQLHPDEVKWIKDNAAGFAYQQGISEESAKQILLIEAASYVDATIQSALKDG